MTFRQLAANNIRGSWQRYLAYFCSCACSVLVFYVFLSFILNHEVQTGYIVKGQRAAVNQGLFTAEIIILIFSFLFISYSTTAFLRSRKKEFGLLTLMGMTQGQLRSMVFLESMFIAALALVTGLIGGIIFSKLFLMIMGVLLGVSAPIPFAIPPLAIAGTAGVFLAIFLGVNTMSMLGVRQSSVRELLKAHRQPKRAPKRHPLLFAVGLLLLALGYYMAWFTNMRNLGGNIIVVTLIVILGTYLVLTQGSVLFCGWLRGRRSVSHRGTNLVTLNRLIFRLGDNARILFIGAILIAVVSTALGTFNSILHNARAMALDMHPFALSYRITSDMPDALAGEALITETVQQVLVEAGARSLEHQFVIGLEAEFSSPELDRMGRFAVTIISNADWNRASELVPTLKPAELGDGEALVIFNYEGQYETEPRQGKIELAGKSYPVNVHQAVIGGFFGGHIRVIVSDRTYRELASLTPASAKIRFHGFQYDNWEKIIDVGISVAEVIPSQSTPYFSVRAEPYQDLKQLGALTMFIGLFVCILFFFAAGSLVYFKLFTELEDDRQQYRILYQIGITKTEVNRIITQELGTLFFLPLALGAVHTGFALKALSNLTPNYDVIRAGLIIAGGYLLAQLAYFLLTRVAYTKQVLR